MCNYVIPAWSRLAHFPHFPIFLWALQVWIFTFRGWQSSELHSSIFFHEESGNRNSQTSWSFPFPSRRVCGNLELFRFICRLNTCKNQHKMCPGLENPSPGFTFTGSFSNLINFTWIFITGRKYFSPVANKSILEQGCFKKTELKSVSKTKKLMLWGSGCCLKAAF